MFFTQIYRIFTYRMYTYIYKKYCKKYIYLLFEKSCTFFQRVNIEIGLTVNPPVRFHWFFKERTPPSEMKPSLKKIRDAYKRKKKI